LVENSNVPQLKIILSENIREFLKLEWSRITLSGTMSSGFFCLCFGKPRFGPHDNPQGRMGSFVVNVIVGAAQLFTVIFCLVGWGWSIWWGLIMLRIAREYKTICYMYRSMINKIRRKYHELPALN
jgi:hypothetical protein